MKTQPIIMKFVAFLVFLTLSLFNPGSLWCAPQPEVLTNAQSRDRLLHQRVEESDPDWRENKSEKFKVLEWLIMQNLLARYQKMEQIEDLDDVLD